MRSSKFDPVMFLVCTGLFLYFFIFEFTVDYTYFNRYIGQWITVPAWHGGIVMGCLCAMMFLFFIVYADELRPVNRRWVRHKIRLAFDKLLVHIRKGIDDYHVWKQS